MHPGFYIGEAVDKGGVSCSGDRCGGDVKCITQFIGKDKLVPTRADVTCCHGSGSLLSVCSHTHTHTHNLVPVILTLGQFYLCLS